MTWKTLDLFFHACRMYLHLWAMRPTMPLGPTSKQQRPTNKSCWYASRLSTQLFTRWWLNQPIWKICSSNWESFPQGSGWKFQKYFSCHHLGDYENPLVFLSFKQKRASGQVLARDFQWATAQKNPGFRILSIECWLVNDGILIIWFMK